MANPRKGDIVEVEFWDHTGGDEPLLFKVWGRLAKVTKLSYNIHHWAYANPEDYESNDPNIEQVSILKRAVVHIWKLYRREG